MGPGEWEEREGEEVGGDQDQDLPQDKGWNQEER